MWAYERESRMLAPLKDGSLSITTDGGTVRRFRSVYLSESSPPVRLAVPGPSVDFAQRACGFPHSKHLFAWCGLSC